MKKDSRANHARYIELNLFPEEKEDYQKDTVSSENEERFYFKITPLHNHPKLKCYFRMKQR